MRRAGARSKRAVRALPRRAVGRGAARGADRHETGAVRCGDALDGGRPEARRFARRAAADARRPRRAIRTPCVAVAWLRERERTGPNVAFAAGWLRRRFEAARDADRQAWRRPVEAARRVPRPVSGERRGPGRRRRRPARRAGGSARWCSSTGRATTIGRIPRGSSTKGNPRRRGAPRGARGDRLALRARPRAPARHLPRCGRSPEAGAVLGDAPRAGRWVRLGDEVDEIRWLPTDERPPAAQLSARHRDACERRARARRAALPGAPREGGRPGATGAGTTTIGRSPPRDIGRRSVCSSTSDSDGSRLRRVESVAALCADGGAAGRRARAAASRRTTCSARTRIRPRRSRSHARRRDRRGVHPRQHRGGARPRGGRRPTAQRLRTAGRRASTWILERDGGPSGRAPGTSRRRGIGSG